MDSGNLLVDLDSRQRIAVVALLIVAAIRDGDFANDEADTINQLLCHEFQLTSAAAQQLIAVAKQRVVKTTSVQVLIGDLNYQISLLQKKAVLLMLMKVIAADGKQTSEEIELITQVKEILLMPDAALHEVYERYFADHHLNGSQH